VARVAKEDVLKVAAAVAKVAKEDLLEMVVVVKEEEVEVEPKAWEIEVAGGKIVGI
jgi:hypothetical protein